MIKGLEALKKWNCGNCKYRNVDCNMVSNDECFIKIIEKELKALEIIKNKRVDITTLFDCDNAEEYNRWVPIRSHYSYRPFELTQEEYELLKEVLL